MKRRIKRTIKALKSRLNASRRDGPRQQGDRARDRGDWATAADLYSRHLRAAPDDFDIWVQLGHAMKETGRLDQAEAAYVKAALLRPRDADLWLMRGHLARLRNDEHTAARHYAESYSIAGDPRAREERDRSRERALGQTSSAGSGAPALRRVGALEVLEGGRIKGWAIDPDRPGAPVALEVLIDGLPSASAAAELTHAEQPAARRFEIDLSTQLDLAARPEVEVRLSRTGETLDGFPIVFGMPERLREWSQRPPIVRSDEEVDGRVSFVMLEPWTAERGAQLTAALKRQTHAEWELLALVDADCKPARRPDRRIRLILQSDAGGAYDPLFTQSKGNWIVPLQPGQTPEPELAHRLLEAFAEGADTVMTDVALHGPNSDAPGGFTAHPAWSPEAFLADVAAPRLAGFSADALRRAGGYRPDASLPFADMLLRACEKSRTITQVPALLARSPYPTPPSAADVAATQAAALRRQARENHLEPASDGRGAQPLEIADALLVVVEADRRLDEIEPRLRLAWREAGAAGQVVLLDPYARTALEAEQVRGIDGRLSYIRCTPDDRTVALNALLSERASQFDSAVLIGEGVKPEPGAARRLAAWLRACPQAALAAGVVLDGVGRCEGIGVIAGPGGGLAPAWSGRLLAEAGPDGRRARRCTGASLDLAAVRTAVFTQGGGFSSHLSGLWRDVDLALRLEPTGWSILVDPEAVARRIGDPAELDAEMARWFRHRWSQRLAAQDPFYSPLLSSDLTHRTGTLEYVWSAGRRTSREGPADLGQARPRLSPSSYPVAA
ncbi:tetratricopeptide repeat protein [Brevundimonas sp. S30B]|uniref:tetratricopeptide repeat protein n=1 Tax=unclassified Brevundimonas TaxID=2622653 RepID=UPI001071FA30|nr:MULTISPECIES: tetratricopeptide repeat protein [unclassified Brevundimonas]QBX38798.1 tetratricopeptide repeat protein [Brevundimonas sp. MF30-B]TFW01390.1 tetratricopeptide repeat protein [Brevundimonas sp. S30B]